MRLKNKHFPLHPRDIFYIFANKYSQSIKILIIFSGMNEERVFLEVILLKDYQRNQLESLFTVTKESILSRLR